MTSTHATGPGALDRLTDRLEAVAAAARLPSVTTPVEKVLGHSPHPPLTDIPIGFWTSAWLVDLLGGPTQARTAQRLVGWGVVSSLPTVATGLADLRYLSGRARRVAATHALCNAGAIGLFAWSWRLRTRDHRGAGIVTSLVAGSLATVAGALGGRLAFGDLDDADQEPTDAPHA